MSDRCPICAGTRRVPFFIAPRYDVPTKFQSDLRAIMEAHSQAHGITAEEVASVMACPVCGGIELELTR